MYEFIGVKYKNILSIDKLTIPQGFITCIVGESGAGKTTLLKLLNKMISPDSGTILFKGTNLDLIDSVYLRRSVVMLPQNPVVFPGNIRDNLLIGLKFAQKQLVSDSKLKQILKKIKLDKNLLENVSVLSGGEIQRIALARILLMEPEVMLLDEPSSALDAETELFVIENIVNYIKNHANTLIMVTHSASIAQKYAENIIKLDAQGVNI